MNKVFLTGVIADLPTFRLEPGDVPHLFFQLRVKHKTRSGEIRNEFYRINAWRNPATWGNGNLKYGQLVGITGYLTQRSYRKDEKQHNIVEIVAEEFQPMRQILPCTVMTAEVRRFAQKTESE